MGWGQESGAPGVRNLRKHPLSDSYEGRASMYMTLSFSPP